MDKDEYQYAEDFQAEQGVMRLRVTGILPQARMQRKGNLFQPLIEACEQANCATAVIDARDVKVDIDTLAVFRAGVDAALASRLGLRLAFVAREETIDYFFVDVAINRGARVEVFTEMEDAMKWASGS